MPSHRIKEAVVAFQSGDLDRAKAVAEKALAEEESPALHHILGLIHCRQGSPEAGVEYLRAAAESEPSNVAYRVMLARALVDTGRAEEVLAMQEPPPVSSPAQLALWRVRAEAADASGRDDLAVESWEKVAAAAPRDWRAWGNLGNALARQMRLDEAAEALVKATQLNTAEPAVRSDAVSALISAGRQHQFFLRFDESERLFRRAHELAPDDRTAIHFLGSALERTNRIKELTDLVEKASVAGISKDRLSYLWAVLAWREGRLEEARDTLAESLPPEEPVAWFALKTKVADALGESESAFEAASAMNRAAIDETVRPEMRDDFARQSAAYREEQRELARTITKAWASKIPTLEDPPTKQVAFLLGFPRSGTTLLDTFLLGHPQIEVLEEKQLVGAARKVAGDIADLPRIARERLEQARATYFQAYSELVRPDFEGMTIDKFPLDMGAAPLIHAMFPGAPILFVQRHPCDVVLSGFLQPFGKVNFSTIEDAADYYDAMMRIWTASLDSLPLNVHTVVYEELVSRPKEVLEGVIGFLGLDWNDRVLDHQRTAIERGTIITPSYDQVTRPVTTKSVGRWKHYRAQLEPVLPILLPWAERLGYRD